MHGQSEWFQVWFVKHFLGRRSTSRIPRLLRLNFSSSHQITTDISWQVKSSSILLVISNNCSKCAPKWMVSSFIRQNIFWGGAHRAPSPDPSPRFISGFALGSGFALNSRALRALDSGIALDIPDNSRKRYRASPSTFDWGPWFGPPKISSWIRPWTGSIWVRTGPVLVIKWWCNQRINRIAIFCSLTTVNEVSQYHWWYVFC